MSETVLLQRDGPIARLTLNRPESLNALNPEMMQAFHDHLLGIRSDEAVKILIVNGAGRAFSAGVDIKTTTAEGFQSGNAFMGLGEAVSDLLTTMPKVTIAQVHGYCFTGALELMLMFDMAFCTDETRFGDTHAKWSVMPRWGMTQRLARRVGLAKAKELTFRAYQVKGPEAERIGLVNRAFPASLFVAEVNQICDDILQNSFEAIVAIKALYDDGFATTLREGLALELAADNNLSSTAARLQQFKK